MWKIYWLINTKKDLQSGRQGELCGTLFTSSLGEIKADFCYIIFIPTCCVVCQRAVFILKQKLLKPTSPILLFFVALSLSRLEVWNRVIHKAGRLSWFSLDVFTAITYPATLIILGLKASTCFRRVCIVFPVPTMAFKGKREKLDWESRRIPKRKWGTERADFISPWIASEKEEVGHTVLILHNLKKYFHWKGEFKTWCFTQTASGLLPRGGKCSGGMKPQKYALSSLSCRCRSTCPTYRVDCTYTLTLNIFQQWMDTV